MTFIILNMVEKMLTNFEQKCQVAVLEQQIMIKKQGGEC
jgi:hypothetical protein